MALRKTFGRGLSLKRRLVNTPDGPRGHFESCGIFFLSSFRLNVSAVEMRRERRAAFAFTDAH